MCCSHIPYFTGDPRVKITATYDPARSDVPELLGVEGITSCGSLRDLLVRVDVDAVVISSPDRFHASQMIEALTYGKHVFVEKPLITSLDELGMLQRAIEVSRTKGLVLSSCHPRRFDPPFVWFKERVSLFRERFGPLVSVTYDFSYKHPTKVGLHLGLLLDHLNHEVDLMNFLWGPVQFTLEKVVDSQQRYEAFGKREDGVTFRFGGTRYLGERRYLEWLEARYERGSVRLDTATGIATVYDHEAGTAFEETCGATDYVVRQRGVCQNFISAVLGEAQSYLTEAELMMNARCGI